MLEASVTLVAAEMPTSAKRCACVIVLLTQKLADAPTASAVVPLPVRTTVDAQFWGAVPAAAAAVVHASGEATSTARRSIPVARPVEGALRVRVYGAGTDPLFVSVTTLVVDNALDVYVKAAGVNPDWMMPRVPALTEADTGTPGAVQLAWATVVPASVRKNARASVSIRLGERMTRRRLAGARTITPGFRR
jgi:hypothetical protein